MDLAGWASQFQARSLDIQATTDWQSVIPANPLRYSLTFLPSQFVNYGVRFGDTPDNTKVFWMRSTSNVLVLTARSHPGILGSEWYVVADGSALVQWWESVQVPGGC